MQRVDPDSLVQCHRMLEPTKFQTYTRSESISPCLCSALLGSLIDWLGFYSLLCSCFSLGFMKVAEIYSDHSLCLVEQSTAVEQPLSPPLLVEIALLIWHLLGSHGTHMSHWVLHSKITNKMTFLL